MAAGIERVESTLAFPTEITDLGLLLTLLGERKEEVDGGPRLVVKGKDSLRLESVGVRRSLGLPLALDLALADTVGVM